LAVNEAIKSALASAIPFNNHLGLELLDVDDRGASVRLPDDPRLRNHVGSQHAGGLFAAAEFASGAAMTGALSAHLAGVTPLAAGATISYQRLAKGAVTATARLGEDADAIAARLASDGRAEFPAHVELADEAGQVVATMTVQWNLRKRS
jgi:acyl-coenzyme A thioesterase PaaI-like protein